MAIKQKMEYQEKYLESLFSSSYMGRLEKEVLVHFNADENLLRLPKNLSMPGHELYFWSLNLEPDIKSEAEREKIVKDTISKIEYLNSWRSEYRQAPQSAQDSLYTTCFFAVGMLNEKMGYFFTAASIYNSAARQCTKSGDYERALNFLNHAEFLYELWGDKHYDSDGVDFADELKSLRKNIINKKSGK